MPEPAQREGGGDRRILIVDDDTGLLEMMADIAADAGFEVEALGEGARLLDTVTAFHPQCIVMDLSIPDCDGVELLRALAETGCTIPIVLVSSHPAKFLDDVRVLGEALGLEMRAVLQKPFPTADFLAALGRS